MARLDRPGRKTERDISTFLRLTRTAAFYLVTFMIVTAGSIWLALQVAPLQTVAPAGPTAPVGAAVPDLSLSGPRGRHPVGPGLPAQPPLTSPRPPAPQPTP